MEVNSNKIFTSLSTKYRPARFEDVIGQRAIIDIIQNEIKTDSLAHVMMFYGPAGTGKTTTARIIANIINGQPNSYIELDAASNNNVDKIRELVQMAKQKSLTSKYKIFILDECHMLTDSSQNALLKIFEDCPPTTIFMLCTTDRQKILPTILSRVQEFRLTRIATVDIVNRLKYICEEENKELKDIKYEEEALLFIAKLADGSMRTAISYLDTCLALNHNVTTENASKALGASEIDFNLDLFYNLYDSLYIADTEEKKQESIKNCIIMLENLYNSGKDLKQFLNQFVKFILDVNKYILFEGSFLNTQLPATDKVKNDLAKYKLSNVKAILNKFVVFKEKTKYETNLLSPIESLILGF